MGIPDYIKYQKSIAEEFKAYENRVRYIIDDHHWGEDGRYKEIILMNYLKRILPNNISVGTGFVKSKTGISKQFVSVSREGLVEYARPLLFIWLDYPIKTSFCKV